MSRLASPSLVHPTARLESGGLTRLVTLGALAVSLVVALAILLHFHNHFWWASGEGAAATAALQLLEGRTGIGAPGLVDLVNALAFRIFGIDLVSLRYPLVALTLVQAGLAFTLLAGRGVLPAFAAALVMASLTFVQFLSPVAEWYALFLCLLIAAVLSRGRTDLRGDLEGVGFLLAVLAFFQPASGAFAAAGVLTFLLLREVRPAERERAVVARGALFLLFAGLALHLRAAADLIPALLFGAAPLLLLGYAFITVGAGNSVVCRMLGRLGVGVLLAAVPFVAFHVFQGTLEAWLLQAVSAATTEPTAGPGFGPLLLGALEQITGGGRTTVLNGVFWLVLPLLPAVLGIAILRAIWRDEEAGRAPLPIMACFFAAAMAQHQSPLALFFTTALTLTGLLYLAAGAGRRGRYAFTCLCLVLALLGLTYQAGRPLSGGWDGMVAGRSKTIVAPLGLPRASLTVAAEEAALYGLLVNLIQANSGDGDRVLALPDNPEVTFLAERPAALPDLRPLIDLNREPAFRAVAGALAQDPPRLLVYRPADWRNTPAVRRLVAGLRGRYRLLDMAGGFEVYLLKDQRSPAAR